MIEKKTTLNQIEITEDSAVQIRIGLLLIDGDREISRKWHRTLIPPGSDATIQMAAVNHHLEQMGEPPLDSLALKKIDAFVALAAKHHGG